MRFRRCEKSPFRFPPPFESSSNQFFINMKQLNKLNHRCGDTTHRDNPIATCIAILRNVILPFAISGFVIAVAVFSAKGHPRLWFTHVLEKVLKLQPLLANRYPPCTIKPKLLVLGIPTTLEHRRPNSVDFWTLDSDCITVLNCGRHSIACSMLCSAVGDGDNRRSLRNNK